MCYKERSFDWIFIELMSASYGFPPIARRNANSLILGTMPGQKSLATNQYYAHPRNAFWPIMVALFNAEKNLSYGQRKKLLTDNRIALWDVLRRCRRDGSLDANIDHTSIETNNFKSFFDRHKQIKTVFFNGGKAEELFRKNVLTELGETGLNFYRLPSTSPAHTMTMEQKLSEWAVLKDFRKR